MKTPALKKSSSPEPPVPIIEAWNKWDLLEADRAEDLSDRIVARPDETIVPVSAITGLGTDALLERLGTMLTAGARQHRFVLAAADGQRIAWLHAHGEVLGEEPAGEDERGPLTGLDVRLTPRELGRFVRL